MIKALMTAPMYPVEQRRATVILGLSRENVTRLTAGQPILVDLSELGDGVGEATHVCIVFGETEAAIVEDLRGHLIPESGAGS